MNVVATRCGCCGRPEAIAAQLGEAVRARRALPTSPRRCLRIGDTYGFVFGNGLMANFLEEYYATGGLRPQPGGVAAVRTFVSALVARALRQPHLPPLRGQRLGRRPALPDRRFTGIGAATVREVGLGFKLNHRADEDADRFSVLAIHAGPCR